MNRFQPRAKRKKKGFIKKIMIIKNMENTTYLVNTAKLMEFPFQKFP